MGLEENISVVCDNCEVTTVSIENQAAVPENWCSVQGFASVVSGTSVAIEGYFCPACVSGQGTKNLVKKAADINSSLTGPNE